MVLGPFPVSLRQRGDGLELLFGVVDGLVVGAEDVLEAALGDLVGHGSGDQPGHLVPLGHLGRHHRHRALVGSDEGRDPLALNDALRLRGAHVRFALGVPEDELELGAAQGRNASFGVDLVSRDDGSRLGLVPLIGGAAAQGIHRPDLHLGHLFACQDWKTSQHQTHRHQDDNARQSFHGAPLFRLRCVSQTDRDHDITCIVRVLTRDGCRTRPRPGHCGSAILSSMHHPLYVPGRRGRVPRRSRRDRMPTRERHYVWF